LTRAAKGASVHSVTEADVKNSRVLAIVMLGAVCLGSHGGAQGREQIIEWPHYGGDAGHGKYSPASDITAANAGDLGLAWTWQTIDRPMPQYNVRPSGFETTPIMVDDVLYASTSFHQVVALNAETGAQLWVFDPRTYEEGPPLSNTGLNSRGVAFWRGDDGEARIFIAGRQRLFAIDAKSGKPVATFAGSGAAPLNANLGRDVPRLHTQATSPPIVYRNLVIVGTGVPDRLQYRGDPPGTVQAFDVRTGSRVWVFFTIPQSAKDFGADTWGNESWKTAGHANVWAPMSLAGAWLFCRRRRRAITGYGGRVRTCSPSRSKLRPHRSAALAFSGDPSRVVGLRLRVGADARDHDRERDESRRRCAGLEAGIHLRVRSRDRATDLADRGAAGRHDHGRPGRARLPDAAVSDPAAPARAAGDFAGRRQRSLAGDQASRRGAAETLPSRAALHAANSQRHDPAAVAERRGELGRRGI
jgi:hypothetical protein